MKAEDLMIGDWVIYENIPTRIEQLGQDGNIFVPERYFDASEHIEPIPLTKEILEKNGFKGDGYAILSIDECNWLEYYYYERRLRKKWRGVDEWQNHAHVTDIMFQCHCSYIHELQHALRLCDIEKEFIV